MTCRQNTTHQTILGGYYYSNILRMFLVVMQVLVICTVEFRPRNNSVISQIIDYV